VVVQLVRRPKCDGQVPLLVSSNVYNKHSGTSGTNYIVLMIQEDNNPGISQWSYYSIKSDGDRIT
jgi:hypothetical protein